MKEGIHLGPPPPRLPWPVLILLFLAGGSALVLGVRYYRADREVSALREEIARREEALSTASTPGFSARAQVVAAQLRSMLDSGALVSLPPTSLVRLMASALPDDVSLSRLSFDAKRASPSLTLEASAFGAEPVSELQRRLAASPAVSKTRLLEERVLPDGRLGVRIQLDLKEPESR